MVDRVAMLAATMRTLMEMSDAEIKVLVHAQVSARLVREDFEMTVRRSVGSGAHRLIALAGARAIVSQRMVEEQRRSTPPPACVQERPELPEPESSRYRIATGVALEVLGVLVLVIGLACGSLACGGSGSTDIGGDPAMANVVADSMAADSSNDPAATDDAGSTATIGDASSKSQDAGPVVHEDAAPPTCAGNQDTACGPSCIDCTGQGGTCGGGTCHVPDAGNPAACTGSHVECCFGSQCDCYVAATCEQVSYVASNPPSAACKAEASEGCKVFITPKGYGEADNYQLCSTATVACGCWDGTTCNASYLATN